MTHGSLFSGIGGFDLAAEWAGWQNLFTCEKDTFCQRVLKYHFSNLKHYEDIKKTNFKKYRGQIDILSGGFPCQPFSVAGKRKGQNDDRYLWPEMLRVIREIRPTWVVAENVNGIVSMVQPGKEFEVESQAYLFEENDKETVLEQEYVVETICKDFEREGYSVQPVIIPACGVEAPHLRYRIWFIANTGSGRGDRVTGNSDGKKENEKIGKGLLCKTARFSGKRTSADAQCGRGMQIFNKIQSAQPDGARINSANGEWNTPNTDSKRQKQQPRNAITRRSRQSCRIFTPTGFSDFPTKSPICSGNDGIAKQLVNITFPKWRAESIKACGNAIVPQIAYEIFKAINEIERY